MAKFRDSVRRAAQAIGVDFHVGAAVSSRLWSIVAGAVTILLVPITLSPEEQGYYYTFGSLLAMQVFFELGLNQVIVYLVGHEASKLSWRNGRIEGGAPEAISRLHSVVVMLRRWYLVAALLFLVVVFLSGFALFGRNGAEPDVWLIPWAVIVGAASINLYCSPFLAFTEGVGQVGQVGALRLVQSLIGCVLMWAGLMAGLGLVAVALMPTIAVICTSLWLRQEGRPTNAVVRASRDAAGGGVDWVREVLPFQWRMAVSWMSGYLVFQAFVPLAFMNLGAVEAGRLGIALSVFSAVLSIGASWVNAKAPHLIQCIQGGDIARARRDFAAVSLRAGGVTLGLCVIVLLAYGVASHLGYPHVSRVVPLSVLLCMALTTTINFSTHALASYMRIYRQEPMMLVSLTCGVLIFVGSVLASYYSVLAMMMVQALVVGFVSLPWAVRLFRRYWVSH